MQPGFTELKKNARYTLKQKWPEAIAVAMTLVALSLLDTIMQGILTTVFKVDTVWSVLEPTELPRYNIIAGVGITVFSLIYGLFVFQPFAIGVLRWFWLTVHGEDCKISEAFYYFSSAKLFFKTVLLSFFLSLRVILGAVVCLLPYLVVNLVTSPEVYNFFGYAMPISLSGLFPLASFFETAGLVMLMFWGARFALFFVPLFTEPELSAKAVLSRSVELTKGKLLRLVGFMFSFFGWALLCILVLPIIFVFPYMLASAVVYGREELRFSKLPKDSFERF